MIDCELLFSFASSEARKTRDIKKFSIGEKRRKFISLSCEHSQ